MVEFALVAPIFFLLLFGIIQLGLIFAGQNGVVSAVRETARYAVPYRVIDVSGADDTCNVYVLPKLQEALGQSVIIFDSSPTVSHMTVTYTTEQDPSSNWYINIRVHETYDFPVWVPLVGAFIDGSDGSVDGHLSLSADEVMRVENNSFTLDPFSGGTATCSN